MKDIIGVAIAIIIIVVLCYSIYKFVKKNHDEKIATVKQWLLFCVTKMESIYGSSTGKIKLRAAWDFALERFPFLATLVTFDEFSKWVDDALEEMRELLENSTIKYLVDNREI